MKQENYVIIPYSSLSEDALNNLINEFILREGTDYGVREFTLEEKHLQILKQLQKGEIQIVFDVDENSASLIKK